LVSPTFIYFLLLKIHHARADKAVLSGFFNLLQYFRANGEDDSNGTNMKFVGGAGYHQDNVTDRVQRCIDPPAAGKNDPSIKKSLPSFPLYALWN
jgi:hypothetical protein